MDEYCRKCGKELTHDEIALYKKIYNRGAKDFLCISCSSQYLQVSEELLLTKMQEFKDMGCTLFLQCYCTQVAFPKDWHKRLT